MTRRLQFSAFIEDMRLDALPQDVQDDIGRFVAAKAHHQFPHYGMVVKELLPKADPVNLKTARAHVKTLPRKTAMKLVQQATRRGSKYVLILNDRIIDGHHFLAKAEHAGVTSSLNILDLTPSRFQFSMNHSYPPQNRERPKSNKLRTAAIVAGGGGLAYGGVKIGQAAEQVRRTAAVAEKAAENARAVTGAIRSPWQALRKVVRFSGGLKSLRKDVVHFAASGTTVAQDRYRKQIKEADTGRAASAYHRTAAAGALLGLALRKTGVTRGRAAGLGALAGIGAQAITRQISSVTKDNFGERSPGGKKLDSAPALAIGAGALIAGRRRIAGKLFSPSIKPRGFTFAVGDLFRSARFKKAVLAGGALAGGITVADTVSAIAERQPGQGLGDAVSHGAKKGAIYGAALAGSEPFIHGLLNRASNLRKVKLSVRSLRKEIQFGGRQQLRDEGNRYVDPLKIASGEGTAYADGQRVDLPVQHAQVVRAAIHKGQTYHRYGQRTGALLKDAVGAVSGQAKLDARGRPQKREWEKSWFRNAVGTAATAGALLGHATLMRRNPVYRGQVAGVVRKGKGAANSVMPGLFPMSARGHGGSTKTLDVQAEVIRLDVTAPEWDVRDQRGRSARVFAPGSRRRERREKKPHETVGFLRKAAVVGALAAAAGGTALGYKLGGLRALKKVAPTEPMKRIIPFPAQA